jgi:outer membrane protein OmpA-like peptidoglycan-associated protein
MKTPNLKSPGIGLALAALGATAPAWADPATSRDSNAKSEDIGIVTGLAVGAAAGGPIGAAIGAAAGGLLGDRYHKEKETRAALAADLRRSEAERSRLATSVTELNGSLAESQTQGAQLEHTRAAVDAIGMDVSFRTDDTAIKVEDMAPLLKLGALAAAVPDAKLRVAGFADPRGAPAYNDELSKRRAEAVAAALECGGIEPGRLIIEAHGAAESDSVAGDLDAYALDRRVTVRLERAAPATPASTTVASARGPVPEGTP